MNGGRRHWRNALGKKGKCRTYRVCSTRCRIQPANTSYRRTMTMISRLRQPSKYKNKLVEIDGIVFRSDKEARRYQDLKLLLRAGTIHDLKWQVPYDLIVEGVKICRYVADFTYRDLDDKLIVEDVKGFRTREYEIKSRLMLACLKIRIIET